MGHSLGTIGGHVGNSCVGLIALALGDAAGGSQLAAGGVVGFAAWAASRRSENQQIDRACRIATKAVIRALKTQVKRWPSTMNGGMVRWK